MRKAEREHHLLTLPIAGGYLHGYVMVSNPRQGVERALNQLYEIAERDLGGVSLPVSLDTKLDAKTVVEIRRLLWKWCPESKDMMRKATTFHLTFVALSGDDPDGKWLMGLH